MANIKSSAKRDEKSKQLRAKNRADKTELWLRSSTRWSKLYPLQRKGTLETWFPRPFGIFIVKTQIIPPFRAGVVRQFYFVLQERHELRFMPFPVSSVHPKE